MSVDSHQRDVFPSLDPDQSSSNPSANRTFGDVLAARMSRRTALQGGAMVAAVGFLTATGVAGSATPAAAHGKPDHGRKPRHGRRLLGFTPVPPSDADAFIV